MGLCSLHIFRRSYQPRQQCLGLTLIDRNEAIVPALMPFVAV